MGWTWLTCLFKLAFENAGDMLAEVAGRSVYLAMDKDNQLWLNTQNLLLNLPLAKPS